MFTITCVGQKGGSGKSTVTVHLAVCAARRGKRVAVLDLDNQRSVLAWRARRTAEDVEVTAARIQDVASLLAERKRQGFDLVLIDTAGRAEDAAAKAMTLADLVLIPCRPFSVDLEAAAVTARQAKQSKAQAWFLLNAVPPQGTRHVEAREALSKLLPVAPEELRSRLVFADALNDGRSVEELDPHGKAAAEIQALYSWVARRGV